MIPIIFGKRLPTEASMNSGDNCLIARSLKHYFPKAKFVYVDWCGEVTIDDAKYKIVGWPRGFFGFSIKRLLNWAMKKKAFRLKKI